MTRVVRVGDTVLALDPPDFPPLGAVTDGSSVVGVLAGTGLFTAPALRTYVNVGMATQAALTSEISSRTAADTAETTARMTVDATFRKPLAANTTWYVSTAGSDANSGLGAGTPWLTLQHAVDTIRDTYDGRGFVGTISVAAGSYNLGSGLVIDGAFTDFAAVNITSPGAVILSSTGHTVLVQNRASVAISGNFLMGPGAGFANVIAQLHGSCHIGGITISPTVGGAQLVATRFGYVETDSDIHVANGTSGNLILASHGGNFRHSNAANIVFDSNHVYTDCTLFALTDADLTITDAAGFNLSGHTVNGQRFRVETAVIQWALGTPTTIPGTSIGAEVMGGRFVWGTTNNSQWAGTFDYDLSTATGATTVITGVGFLPAMLDFVAVAASGGGPASVGMATAIYNGATSSAAWNHCATGGAAGCQPAPTSCIGWSISPGNAVSAAVSALGSDGFTLTWTKAGTVTGTITVFWRARRGL